MTAMFAGMNYTYLTAMVKGSAANAIWLQCTAPVWVLLVGVLVFGERAVWRDWLMVAFAIAGVLFILYFEVRGADLAAVGWGLASGLCYAGVVLSLRQPANARPGMAGGIESSRDGGLSWLRSCWPVRTFPHGIQWFLLAGFGILQMASAVCAVRAWSEAQLPGTRRRPSG